VLSDDVDAWHLPAIESHDRLRADGDAFGALACAAEALERLHRELGAPPAMDRWIDAFDEDLADAQPTTSARADPYVFRAGLAVLGRRPTHPSLPYAALAFLTLFGYLLTDRFVRALNESERLNVDLAVPPDDRRPPPVRALLALACALFSTAAMSKTPGDYSERLDALWNFDQPVASEARFRAEAARHPAGSREASEAATQQARALGLQRRFDDADRALEAIVGALARLPARVRVRYLLERGRRDNSSGNRRSAFAWFEQALAASSDDVLPGADYYRVDALHMLAIAAPPERQLEWNRKALAAADAARDARARGWRASLLHNLGWTMHERGDYAAALAYWQQALAAREASHDLARTRIARWTVARGLRSLGRLDEAEAMQRSLADELQAAGAPDGYVFEELAEIALARGDRAAARPFASKAFALLSQDADLRATEPERLARLSELAR
jgi:tetratricopeptide (TPR) repeat protein